MYAKSSTADTPEPGPITLGLTVTNTHLLNGLRDRENEAAWERYVQRYRPIVVAYLERSGLPLEEAEDVAQETLLAFSRDYLEGRYERQRGTLRSWLLAITHHRLLHQRQRRQRGGRTPQTIAEKALQSQPDPGPSERELWEQEWQRAVLQQCLQQVQTEVQPETYQAFRQFALEKRPADEVAAELKLTRNAVYLAKRRVLERLQQLRPLVEAAL
jgi:RNA polymerase sigma-70 factor (ECF subfamily)